MNAAADHVAWKPRSNPWLIAVVVTLAAFMEILDTTIVNVALPHIAGSLSISPDDATWALTSYLVANAIILPVGAWASSVIGRRNFFQLCIVIFTVSSFLCGIAPSLPMLLIFRVFQGIGGGGLQPMAQAIMADSFEERKRGLAFSLYGLVAVLAPSIGPTLGGWITDNYSWRWIFYINLPLGVVAFVVIALVLRVPSADVRYRIDYLGMALLAGGLSAIVLFTSLGGNTYAWGSAQIIGLAILGLVLLAGFVFAESRAAEPVLPLRLFRNSVFSIASIVGFIVGFALFGAVTYLPLFLQVVGGATPTGSGLQILPLMAGLLITSIGSGQLI